MKPVLLLGAAALVAAVVAWFVGIAAPADVLGASSAAVSVAASAAKPSAQSPKVGASATLVLASPETTRLEQRRVLYETVDALLQASEFERARRLLDEDQERHGDELAPEWRDLTQGYRLMADCMETPSAKHRARGEAFALVNEAASLNAKLRAACAPK